MDKLTEFGHTFQVKSIACLMKEQTFLEQIHDILDEKHYDGDSLKWIVKQMKRTRSSDGPAPASKDIACCTSWCAKLTKASL